MNARASGRWLILGAALLLGCGNERAAVAPVPSADWFGPRAMRVHPIFTQLADLDHSGKPDGIEAQLEFTDQFGDPTKASGRVLFELFEYRTDSPDPRSKRLDKWVMSTDTLADQRDKWNTTLRTYRFQLPYPQIRADQGYVLSAIFELSAGGRLEDRIVLPAHIEPATPSKGPAGMGAL